MRYRRIALASGLGILAIAAMRGRLRRYEIAEHSMQPAFDPGDYVIAQVRRGIPDRGDVVIFNHPKRPGFELVKRVVGLPGEDVAISNAQVHIDGSVLAEPWADGPTIGDGSWSLGDLEVFVLGDNRAHSAGDSRTVGPIPLGDVGWRVDFRYWPIGSVGRT